MEGPQEGEFGIETLGAYARALRCPRFSVSGLLERRTVAYRIFTTIAAHEGCAPHFYRYDRLPFIGRFVGAHYAKKNLLSADELIWGSSRQDLNNQLI